ncbi:MAG: hypothetical protein E6556_22260, partial [Pantoea sp.]|nr:hypothetical protein [Pantoea sp.]
ASSLRGPQRRVIRRSFGENSTLFAGFSHREAVGDDENRLAINNVTLAGKIKRIGSAITIIS